MPTPLNEIPGRRAVASTAVRLAARKGHEAEHVVDVGLGAATDESIASYAEQSGAVLISKDEDFVQLVEANGFAFLWLRCGNCTNAALREWIEPRWADVEALLESEERLVEAR